MLLNKSKIATSDTALNPRYDPEGVSEWVVGPGAASGNAYSGTTNTGADHWEVRISRLFLAPGDYALEKLVARVSFTETRSTRVRRNRKRG